MRAKTGVTDRNRGKQQIHYWQLERIIKMLLFRLKGIHILKIDENCTSQTYCKYNTRQKFGRVHRDRYICKQFGTAIKADVKGTIINISRGK